MLDREVTHEDGPATSLDQAWVATRPDDLSPEAFDRIWVEVLRVYDRPRILPISDPKRSVALVAIGLSQAAAILVMAWFFTRPRPDPMKHPVDLVVRIDPRPTLMSRLGNSDSDPIDVDPDETHVVEFSKDGVPSVRVLDSGLNSVLAFNNDALNTFEALSQ